MERIFKMDGPLGERCPCKNAVSGGAADYSAKPSSMSPASPVLGGGTADYASLRTNFRYAAPTIATSHTVAMTAATAGSE